MPSDRFLLNAWFGIDIQSQNVGVAIVQAQPTNPASSFVYDLNAPNGSTSQSFPFGINGSYRVTDKLTFNGGVAYYTNFIDQGVAFGAGGDHTFSGPVYPYGLLQNQWGYASRASVFTLGSRYDITPKLRLSGQAEFVKGVESAVQTAGDPRDAMFPAPPRRFCPAYPSTCDKTLPAHACQRASITSSTKHWSTYFRYVLFIYEDSADQAQIATSPARLRGCRFRALQTCSSEALAASSEKLALSQRYILQTVSRRLRAAGCL